MVSSELISSCKPNRNETRESRLALTISTQIISYKRYLTDVSFRFVTGNSFLIKEIIGEERLFSLLMTNYFQLATFVFDFSVVFCCDLLVKL